MWHPARTIISPDGVIQGGTSVESRLALILFYRDIIVESECHGVTRHSRECLVRLVSFRGECRLLDISSLNECYSAQVKSIESRRAFNEGERERGIAFLKRKRECKKEMIALC